MDIIKYEEKNSRQRIDRFLKEEIFFNSQITRGELIRQIKNGRVLVDGKPVKPSYMLRDGEEITVDISESRKSLLPNNDLKIEIVYKDEDVIVVNKPAGLQVHPDHLERDDTLANILLAKFPEISLVGDAPELRPGIVHRLDRDTSGIILIARNQESFDELKKQFQKHEVRKKYLAVVHGSMEEKTGVINKPLARATTYKKQVVAGKKTRTKIRTAITEYRVLEESKDFSLVEVSPRTGRMHQIRVHMASIGHPVVGDKKYGPRSHRPMSERQLLHAEGIEFSIKGKEYSFSVDAPDDFQKFIEHELR